MAVNPNNTIFLAGLYSLPCLDKACLSYSTSIDNLRQEETVTVSLVPTNDTEFDAKSFSLKRIMSDIQYLMVQWKEADVLRRELRLSSIRTSEPESVSSLPRRSNRDHLAIDAKDLPVFDVRPQPITDDVTLPQKDNTYSLSSFLTKFERAYKNKDVDIKLHWQFNLEACFENTIYANGFNTNIKKPLLQ
ncbi:hypothetical protein BDB01DRAFT_855584 [Pilobolus umbonatus]|nr:hypothetical protein BDB01DRAFT_855584 [Pilobolus umbonatus]